MNKKNKRLNLKILETINLKQKNLKYKSNNNHWKITFTKLKLNNNRRVQLIIHPNSFVFILKINSHYLKLVKVLYFSNKTISTFSDRNV